MKMKNKEENNIIVDKEIQKIYNNKKIRNTIIYIIISIILTLTFIIADSYTRNHYNYIETSASVIEAKSKEVEILVRQSRGKYKTVKKNLYDLIVQYEVEGIKHESVVENIEKKYEKIKIYYDRNDPSKIEVNDYTLIKFIDKLIIISSIWSILLIIRLFQLKKYNI